MGVELLRKSGREIELTDAGRSVSDSQIGDLFDRIEMSSMTVTVDKGNPRRLRLKVLPSFAIKWLVPRLTGFYALHSDIDIEIATVAEPEDLHLEMPTSSCATASGNGMTSTSITYSTKPSCPSALRLSPRLSFASAICCRPSYCTR